MFKKIAIAAALLAATMTSAAKANSDEWNIATLTCSNKAGIEYLMKDVISKSAAAKKEGVEFLYIKGKPVELSRNKNELRCQINIVTSQKFYDGGGVFRLANEDGHPIMAFDPN